MKKDIEYWTIWNQTDCCSRHKSCAAAERAARQCERDGGMDHMIFKVEQCPRPFWKPRSGAKAGKK